MRILIGVADVHAAAGSIISGRIVEDHTGQAVISAEVKIRQMGVRILSADLETNGQGHFQTPSR